MNRMMGSLLGAVALMMSACTPAPAGQAPMWSHFDAAGDAHETVIRGDLANARAAGAWLARGRNPSLPKGAEPLDAALRLHATQLASAPDIGAAATELARMAGTCGECHRRFGPGPSFSGQGVPFEGGPEPSREMRRHAWGAGRLWEGLIGPSDAAWKSGAEVLRDAWMLSEWIAAEPDAELVVRTMETRVRRLGTEALVVQDRVDRENIYADVIGTCAECHSIVRRAKG
jgi:hypothetical protein